MKDSTKYAEISAATIFCLCYKNEGFVHCHDHIISIPKLTQTGRSYEVSVLEGTRYPRLPRLPRLPQLSPAPPALPDPPWLVYLLLNTKA